MFIIDYDKLVCTSFNKFSFKIHYEFDNVTAQKLIHSLRNFPIETDPEKRLSIKLGYSFDKVGFDIILKLL